jgi:hypothetical protein
MLKKCVAVLILFAISACDNATFGSREYALKYLMFSQPGEARNPLLHNLSYYMVWCAENDGVYWPKAVQFCSSKNGTYSTDICSYVNIVDLARTKGSKTCDPS